MNITAMFSSKTDQWATPQEFFEGLNKEFGFTLDPCADESNHKCDMYFTKQEDGLSKDWGGMWCFAILLMAERFRTGLRNALKRFIWENACVR